MLIVDELFPPPCILWCWPWMPNYILPPNLYTGFWLPWSSRRSAWTEEGSCNVASDRGKWIQTWMLTFHFRDYLPTLTSWWGKSIPPLSQLSSQLEPCPCLPASLPSEIIKVLKKSLVDPHPCKWSLSLGWYVIWVLRVACASRPPPLGECGVIWVGVCAAGERHETAGEVVWENVCFGRRASEAEPDSSGGPVTQSCAGCGVKTWPL